MEAARLPKRAVGVESGLSSGKDGRIGRQVIGSHSCAPLGASGTPRAAFQVDPPAYRLLFQAGTEGLIVASAHGTVCEANPEACRLLRCTRGEITSTDLGAFFDPSDPWLERAREERRSEGGFGGELRLLRGDGTSLRAEVSMVVYRHGDGEERIGVTFRDIGERKRAEEVRRQRDFYETLLQAQSDGGEGLLVVEGERIRWTNDAFCRMSGYSAEELIALPTYLDLATEEQRPVLEHRMRRRLRGGRVEDRYETAILHRSGRRVELKVSVRPLRREGQLPQLVVVARDITASKRGEERLKSSLGMLVAVHEAGRVLSSSLDPGEIGQRLLNIMSRVSKLDAAILRASDQRGRLAVVCTCGPEALWRVASAAPEAQAARLEALDTGEYRRPFRLAQPKEGGLPAMPALGLCLPLVARARERVVGVLEAYGPEALKQDMAVETLQSLAGQAASALENARLYGELAERERRLNDLVGKLIEVKEEERRRLAYEVHDGLTQVAIAAHQHLQAFAKHYLPDSGSGQTKLDGTLKLARQTVREARNVIADLRPTALEDFGLAAALRSKVEALRGDGWEIGYDEALGGERLPDEIETALYRVTQEALANIRKHAQTLRTHITLARRDKSAYLEIRDWGQGFEQGAVQKVGGWGEQMGIHGMRERIALLGGEFAIFSRPGEGTRVVAEVTLPASGG